MADQDVLLGNSGPVTVFATEQESIVRAEHLSKRFGDQEAVVDLNFTVEPGTIFGFIGPSGSGKTTTVRLLTGILPPSEGDVEVLGYHPRDFPRRIREKIGYMPQLFFLYEQLTVWENMNFMASLYGMNLFRRKILHELLEFVELEGHEKKRVDQLSGGMKRRLSLAATLIQNPTLLFLDEPTAGIDPVLRRKIWTHFEEFKAQGKTMFVTTQYVGEVAYCDMVGVMNGGRLIMVDSPAQIRYRTYGGDMVDVVTEKPIGYDFIQEVERLPFVKSRVRADGTNLRIVVEEASAAIPDLMTWFSESDISVQTIEEYLPPFDDVFVDLIEQKEKDV